MESALSAAARKVRPQRAIAPALLLLETSNALLRYQRFAGEINPARIRLVIEKIESIFDEIVDDRRLHSAAIDIASAHNHKIYDCLYLALALDRVQPLATADRRLAAIARSLSIETELIEPSL